MEGRLHGRDTQDDCSLALGNLLDQTLLHLLPTHPLPQLVTVLIFGPEQLRLLVY